MSSTGSPTLAIDVSARRGEHCIVLAATLVVPGVLLLLDGPLAIRLSAAVIVTGLVLLGFRYVGWTGSQRVTRIVCRPEGDWSLYAANGQVIQTELAASSRLSTHALWLTWNERRLRPLLLLAGDISPTDFRRLRVRLHVAPFREPDAIEEMV